MSDSSPLAGLTNDQADEAIQRLQGKVDEGVGGKAAKEHLREMKEARKTHVEPGQAGDIDNGGNGPRVDAQPAEISTEVKDLGGGE